MFQFRILLIEPNEFYSDAISPRATSDSTDHQERHQVDVGRNLFIATTVETSKKDKDGESQSKPNKKVSDECQRKESLEDTPDKANKKLYRVRLLKTCL